MPPLSTPLFALAFDHRQSLRTGFLGLTGPPTADEVALCRRLKATVFEGFLVAVDQGLPGGHPAILMDEQYGADVIAQARDRGITLVVPVEASGQDELRFEHRDSGFGSVIERVDPTYVKALVRYDPSGDPTVNRRQRRRLGRLQTWLDDHGRDWMLEVLAPHRTGPTQFAREAAGPTVRAIEELAGEGLRPAFWKLEGMPSTVAFEAVVEAVRRCGRDDTACLVLGRGADPTAVERWLAQAAPVGGYRGFAVGRTLWWEPLRALLHISNGEARQMAVASIAHNYLRMIDVYLGAMNDA